MRRARHALWIGVWLVLLDSLGAQVPSEQSRIICDAKDPANLCPGPNCRCVEDTIEITFDGDSDSVFGYGGFLDDLAIRATVVTETKSSKVQGWSYGVRHDEAALALESVGTAGTDAEALMSEGFNETTLEQVETCGDDPPCANALRRDGGGWISGVVLAFTQAVELPLGRNTLATAEYKLKKDVGTYGTRIQVTGRLARKMSPPAALEVTVGGKARTWTTAVDGWVGRVDGSLVPFRRGDVGLRGGTGHKAADGRFNIADPVRILRKLYLGLGLEFVCEEAADADDDGKVDLTDVIYLVNYLFVGGPENPPPPAPFESTGLDLTPDGLSCDQYP